MTTQQHHNPPTCSVSGCDQPADYEVLLEDIYLNVGVKPLFFRAQDHTRPYLCARHQRENEAGAEGEVEARGVVRYPHTNRHRAQGATGYRCLHRTADHQVDQVISPLEDWLRRGGRQLKQCLMVGSPPASGPIRQYRAPRYREPDKNMSGAPFRAFRRVDGPR